MVIVHMSGGFGNQLYSYAFGYSLAKLRGDKLAIDISVLNESWYFRKPLILNMDIHVDKIITYKHSRAKLLKPLNRLRYYFNIGLTTKIVCQEDGNSKDLNYYHEKYKKHKNLYIKGYWGSVNYFKPYIHDIHSLYKFKCPLSESAVQIADEMASCNSVAIHYRTGDYIGLGSVLSPECYKEAMQYIATTVEKPVFYVFTEDISWVKRQFKDLPHDIKYPSFTSPNKDIEDFQLISLANHQIISNSSYSWWAAYLNTKSNHLVVSPKGSIWDDDFCLSEWHAIPERRLRKQEYDSL